MPDWDVVIIGGGAAGLRAGAAAAGAGLSCLVIDRMGGGGELMNLGVLHDLQEVLTGPELMARLLDGAVGAGAELAVAEVTAVQPSAGGWQVVTDDGVHLARAVVLAVGLAPGTLGLDEEAAFEGRGLSHCAACDGPLYAGQPVVVAGGGRWAVQEARELVGVASEVTLVTHGDPVPDVDGVVVVSGRIVGLHGSGGLDFVTVETGDTPRRLPARAVFVQTGRRPALAFLPDAVARDRDGRVITDAALASTLPGLFAIGDCRGGGARTLAAAMADGSGLAWRDVPRQPGA